MATPVNGSEGSRVSPSRLLSNPSSDPLAQLITQCAADREAALKIMAEMSGQIQGLQGRLDLETGQRKVSNQLITNLTTEVNALKGRAEVLEGRLSLEEEKNKDLLRQNNGMRGTIEELSFRIERMREEQRTLEGRANQDAQEKEATAIRHNEEKNQLRIQIDALTIAEQRATLQARLSVLEKDAADIENAQQGEGVVGGGAGVVGGAFWGLIFGGLPGAIIGAAVGAPLMGLGRYYFPPETVAARLDAIKKEIAEIQLSLQRLGY